MVEHLLCLPLVVTREVYCFPRRQLIFTLVGVSYIIWKVFETTFRNRLRLSVPRSSNE